MIKRNFCLGAGWHKGAWWFLLPAIEFKPYGDKIFTKSSWTIEFHWLKGFVEFGYLKLKDKT